MKNKTLGYIILSTLGFAIVTAILEGGAITYETAESFYMLSGFSLFIFGTWASLRLIKGE